MVAVKLAKFKQFFDIPVARHDILNYACLGLMRRRIDEEVSEDPGEHLRFLVFGCSTLDVQANAECASSCYIGTRGVIRE